VSQIIVMSHGLSIHASPHCCLFLYSVIVILFIMALYSIPLLRKVNVEEYTAGSDPQGPQVKDVPLVSITDITVV